MVPVTAVVANLIVLIVPLQQEIESETEDSRGGGGGGRGGRGVQSRKMRILNSSDHYPMRCCVNVITSDVPS